MAIAISDANEAGEVGNNTDSELTMMKKTAAVTNPTTIKRSTCRPISWRGSEALKVSAAAH